MPRTLDELLARPGRALAVLLPIALLLALPAVFVRFGGTLLDLLPDRPVARALARAVDAVAAEDVDVVLVEGTDPARVRTVTQSLADALARSPRVASSMARVPVIAQEPSPEALFDSVVLRGDDATLAGLRARFGPQGAEQAATRIRAIALAPGGGALRDALVRDPYDLAPLLGARLAHLGAGIRPDADGALVSRDGLARLIVLRARGSAFDMAFDDALAGDVEPALAHASSGGVRARWTGPHVVARATRDLIRDDITRSSILAGVLVTVIFLATMRRPRALIGVGVPLLIGAAWTSALAAVALRGLNAVTAAFAAIVLGVGLDTGVHVYDRVLSERRAGRGPHEAAAVAVRAMAGPVMTAALTAAAAFGALCASELRALRELGFLAASGEVLTAIAIIVLTPPLAALLEKSAPPHVPADGGAVARSLGAVAGARWTPTVVVVSVTAMLLALALGGGPRLGDTVVLVRPRGLAPLEVQSAVFARFGGEPGQWIAVGEAPDLEHALRASERIERALAPLLADGSLRGFDTVAALAPSLEGQRERRDAVTQLDPAGAAARLDAALASRGARTELFAPGLAPLRAPVPEPRASDPFDGPAAPLARRFLARRSGHIVYLAFVRPAPDRDTALVRARTERALASVPHDRGSLALTGYPLLEADVRAALRADTARVGGLAATLVAALLLIALRRPRKVLLALAGVAVELVALFALLGALHVALDAYNLLAVPVLVGITIDEIVFVLHAFDEAKGTPRERARAAVASMARATSATAGATAAGFLALAACRFDALRGLGLVAGLGTLLGFVCAVIVVPALARLVATDASR